MTHRIFVMVLSLSLIVPFLNAQQTENEPTQERQQSLQLGRALVGSYVAIRNYANPIIVNMILKKLGNNNSSVAIASQCAFDIASHVAAYKYLGSSKKTSELLKGGAAFAVEGMASKTIDTIVDTISDKYFPITKHYGLFDIIKGRKFLIGLGLNSSVRIQEILAHDRKLFKMNIAIQDSLGKACKNVVNNTADNDLKLLMSPFVKQINNSMTDSASQFVRTLQISKQSKMGIFLDFLVAAKFASKLGLSMLASNILQRWA